MGVHHLVLINAAHFIKGAVVLRPKLHWRGTESVIILEPFVAKLFKLLHDKARIPACWKHAKLSPLQRKGPLLDPNSYRMLAVSGTMCRMYANVVRALLTDWCQEANKIPDTEFGSCPGRNTLQPMMVQKLHVCILREDESGAVTCTEDVCVTHMLYADDFTLLSNEAGALQIMSSRLKVSARKKHCQHCYGRGCALQLNREQSPCSYDWQ
eukprot:1159903-Pelagomonas_calceolata.AAC.6